MQTPGGDILLAREHFLLHFARHLRAKIADPHHAFAHTAPHVAAGPAAVQHGTGAPGVVVTPFMRHRNDLRLRCHLAHIRVVGHCHLAALLGRHHHRVRTGVESQHIRTLIEQGHGGVALTRRIEPGVEPDQPDLCVRVDRAHPERERIDALQHLGNGETSDVSGHIAARHAACGNTCEVTPFVIPRVGNRHVGSRLVTGNGLETHAGKLGGHLEGGLHVAKTRREDQLAALQRQIADHPFRVRPFGDILYIDRLHTFYR